MKRVAVFCDRCGKMVEQQAMTLTVEYGDTGDITPKSYVIPAKLRRMIEEECERDYCEDCMMEIMEFAHINMSREGYLAEKKEEREAVKAEKEQGKNIAAGKQEKEKIPQGLRVEVEQAYARGVEPQEIARRRKIKLDVVAAIVKKVQDAG